MLAGPQATREFLEGDRVWVRNYHTPEKWKKSMVIGKCGSVDYQVQVGAHVWSSCRSNATRSRYSSPRVRKRPTRSVDVKRSNSTAKPSTTTGFCRINRPGTTSRATSDRSNFASSGCPRQSLAVNIHCEFSSRFHSDSKRIRSGFESKRRESPRIHNVFAQQYGFANFGRVFTVIHCETLSWACVRF